MSELLEQVIDDEQDATSIKYRIYVDTKNYRIHAKQRAAIKKLVGKLGHELNWKMALILQDQSDYNVAVEMDSSSTGNHAIPFVE